MKGGNLTYMVLDVQIWRIVFCKKSYFKIIKKNLRDKSEYYGKEVILL